MKNPDTIKKNDPILEALYFYLNLIYQTSIPIKIEVKEGEAVRIYGEETQKAISFYENAIRGRKELLAKEKP